MPGAARILPLTPERVAQLRRMGAQACRDGRPMNSWPLTLGPLEVLEWWEGWRAECSVALGQ